VAVLLIVALVTAFEGFDLDVKIKEQLDQIKTGA
jgi:hypothetical protein